MHQRALPLWWLLGSELEAPIPFLPSWPGPRGVRTTQLNRARRAPSTFQDQVLLTLPSPQYQELDHMMGVRWQV